VILKKRVRALLIISGLFVVASVCFSLVGFEQRLVRDDGIYLYSGQQVAEGIPPYVSIFDHKGPLGPLCAGVGVLLGRTFGVDDILAVRILFCVLSAFSAVALYFLAREVFDSPWIAVLTFLIFLNYSGFGQHAASGPRAKTVMLLFEILALLFTCRRQWFFAGIAGALSALTWQPVAVFFFPAAFCLALFQPRTMVEGFRSAGKVVLGALIPLVLVTLYFVYNGALLDFWDGAVSFNIIHLERSPTVLWKSPVKILYAVMLGYRTMALLIILAMGMLPLIFFHRVKQTGGRFVDWLKTDRSAVFYLTFPIPLLWSLIDFQGYPDFYVLLPYTAVVSGFLVGWIIHGAGSLFDYQPLKTFLLILTVASLLVTASAQYTMNRNQMLDEQKRWAQQIVELVPEDQELLCIGVPEAMAMMNRKNANRFLFIINGIDNYIAANTPGGFEGWVADLEKRRPFAVLFGSTKGRHRDTLVQWLELHYRPVQAGAWLLYVRNE
jgi:hypothetical protein